MRGLLTVLTGPSGVGKNTICTALLERFKPLGAVKTVSSTTRQPRVGEEEDGVHYHFLSREVFERQIAQGDFLEYAPYGANLYGTNRRMLERLLEQSRLVIADLEIKGCRQLKEKGINPLICPIIPDDVAVLEQRIRARPGVREADVVNRLAEAVREVTAITSGEFGPPIINCRDRIGEAIDEIQRRIEIRLSKRR